MSALYVVARPIDAASVETLEVKRSLYSAVECARPLGALVLPVVYAARPSRRPERGDVLGIYVEPSGRFAVAPPERSKP